MFRSHALIAALVLLISASPSSAATWLVPAQALTIQAGIDSASAGDTVLVSCGTYQEHDITMKSGIVLLSESGDASCVTVDAQSAGRVIYCDGVDSTTTIQGFTLTGGYSLEGGGMYCWNSSPAVVSCFFDSNSVVMLECEKTRQAAAAGGAVFCESSSPTFSGCYFARNEAYAEMGCTAVGGALYLVNASPVFYDCIFEINTALDYGGVVFMGGSPATTAPVFDHCTFRGNSAQRGGAIYGSSCGPTFTYCTLAYNSASQYGGGLSLGLGDLTMSNCTLYENSAPDGGGMSFTNDGTPDTISNVIIVFGPEGNAVYCQNSNPTFLCSDIYGNAGGDWTGCLAGQEGVNGNISLDPLFCDVIDGTYEISWTSPCAPYSLPNPSCDLIGAWELSCDAEPEITGISDVGGDQGQQVRVEWNRCPNDAPGTAYTITHYSLWRRIDTYLTGEGGPGTAGGPAIAAYPPGDWDFVKTVPAYCESTYNTVCETVCDSTISEGMCWSVFFVRAGTDDPAAYFDSEPDSGYSLDNLEPTAPTGLLAGAGAAVVTLTWDPNEEEDFNYYAVYRDTVEDFTPGEPIGYATTENYEDDTIPGPDTYYYKVTATDFAGNESEPSLPAGMATDVAGSGMVAPPRFFLGPATPNPFNPVTEISYGIPAGAEPSRCELAVYDPTGRKVRTLVDGDRGPGSYNAIWSGVDHRGSPAASGVYFYHLTWADRVETRRMVLVK